MLTKGRFDKWLKTPEAIRYVFSYKWLGEDRIKLSISRNISTNSYQEMLEKAGIMVEIIEYSKDEASLTLKIYE